MVKQLAIRVEGRNLIQLDEHGAPVGSPIPCERILSLEVCPFDRYRPEGDWTIMCRMREAPTAWLTEK